MVTLISLVSPQLFLINRDNDTKGAEVYQALASVIVPSARHTLTFVPPHNDYRPHYADGETEA